MVASRDGATQAESCRLAIASVWTKQKTRRIVNVAGVATGGRALGSKHAPVPIEDDQRRHTAVPHHVHLPATFHMGGRSTNAQGLWGALGSRHSALDYFEGSFPRSPFYEKCSKPEGVADLGFRVSPRHVDPQPRESHQSQTIDHVGSWQALFLPRLDASVHLLSAHIRASVKPSATHPQSGLQKQSLCRG